MYLPDDHDHALQLYVLERNVHHLRTLIIIEHDVLKLGVLRNLLDSAQQDLSRYKSEHDTHT